MWFQRLKYQRLRRRVQAQGIPEAPTPQTLLTCAALLDVRFLPVYQPAAGLRIELEVVYPNVERFLKGLAKASQTVLDNVSVDHKHHIKRTQEGGLHRIRLDDYLINDRRHPQAYKEVVNAVHRQLVELCEYLITIQTLSPNRYHYYQRQYTHLMRECHAVVLGLIEVQTHGG